MCFSAAFNGYTHTVWGMAMFGGIEHTFKAVASESGGTYWEPPEADFNLEWDVELPPYREMESSTEEPLAAYGDDANVRTT